MHPLVYQLRFARSEFMRCLEGLSAEDAVRRVMPMNSITWMIGHLANQEQRYYLEFPGRELVAPGLVDRVGTGRPASTPPLDEMLGIWQAVTRAADVYLETLGTAELQTFHTYHGRTVPESAGTLLQRNIYHYWFHTGEAHAVRQVLGHKDLPQFVGEMNEAPYRPEEGD